MDDLYFFYSAKMAVVFFILMLSSVTLEAQRNENDKFYDLVTAIGEDFGGEFIDARKVLELDLNGANSFLEELHTFATREIVTKNENGQFECKESKKPDFKMAIQTIFGQKVQNLLKAIIVPKPIKTILDDKSDKKVEDLLKELSVKFSEEKLFNLLFSFAARLEALVHGKNIDGTLKEKQENPKDKIQTFLAVPKCFILPERETNIFDYWIEIIKMKTKNSQEPIFGVAIYKKTPGGYSNDSLANYHILKQLNDQRFSIYESLNFLRAAFNQAYATINYRDEEINRSYAAKLSKQKHILRRKLLQIFENLSYQINSVRINKYWDKRCEYAMFFQNISENLMKMISDKGIDPELHLESIDFKIQEYVQNDVEENCKKFDKKIYFLNNLHYELAINFEFNQRKDIYERVENLLASWVGDWTMYRFNLLQLSEEAYLKKNAPKMLDKIKNFIKNTNRESISIIDALIGKEHIDQFNLVSLFDQIKSLVKVTIPKEQAKLWKAIIEIKAEQLENEIEFLKNNPKSIAEEKFQKVVAIICSIKQFGKKVKMLKSKIKNIEIKEQLNELSSKIQKNEMEYFGQELCEQMEKSCNQLKHKQIEIEETVSEEILLKDLQFEFNKIWNSYNGVWRGIEEYYLSIQLMQLTEQARTFAKTFGKMLENVKEIYGQKKDASNDGGGGMIMSE